MCRLARPAQRLGIGSVGATTADHLGLLLTENANGPTPRGGAAAAPPQHADGHERAGRHGRRPRCSARSERAERRRSHLQGHCQHRADDAPRRAPPTSQSHTQQQRSRTQMGTNGPDDAAAICGAACGASRQRGTGRTCRATASSEQTNAPPRGDRQPAKHPQLHGEKNVRKGADGQPNAGQDDILRVKGATQPGRSRLVADGAGSQCGGNAWTRGWWHRPTPRQRSTSIWHRPLLGRWKANPPSVGTKKARRRRH